MMPLSHCLGYFPTPTMNIAPGPQVCVESLQRKLTNAPALSAAKKPVSAGSVNAVSEFSESISIALVIP